MPGSFSFDSFDSFKLDIDVAHFFQPPRHTTSASSSLHTSTTSLPPLTTTTSRKRRYDSHLSDQATPSKAQSYVSPSLVPCKSSALESPTSLSPAPFVSTQYRLAGGLDTPTARLIMNEGSREDQTSPDLHLRGGRGVRTFDLALDSYFPHSAPALSRESNGRPRQHTSPKIQDGLGKAVHGMVLVAGKVWDFCRTTAFKGFYAGGGQGYEMKSPSE